MPPSLACISGPGQCLQLATGASTKHTSAPSALKQPHVASWRRLNKMTSSDVLCCFLMFCAPLQGFASARFALLRGFR